MHGDFSDLPGVSELVRWFGCWPSFHDAEVLYLELHRTGRSTVRIHTFERTNQVDDRGFFVCVKHVTVSFVLEGVTDLHLDGFSAQNVISGLTVKRRDQGYELALGGCYGVEGTIMADRISIDLRPGVPDGSQYGKAAQPE